MSGQVVLYQNQTDELDKNLRERENELLKVKEEKRKVQERLLSLEDDHSLLIKENQQREVINGLIKLINDNDQ